MEQRKLLSLVWFEREGNIKTQSVLKDALKSKGLQELVRKSIDMQNSVLITDEYKGYTNMHRIINHVTINHSKSYVNDWIHTNTIERFWAIVKRGITGQFHIECKKYLDSYLNEFCYRYNARKLEGATLFGMTIDRMLMV